MPIKRRAYLQYLRVNGMEMVQVNCETVTYIMRKDLLLCFFDLSMSDAARIMRICVTVLKKLRSWVGLDIWPCTDVIAGRFWASMEQIRETRLGVIREMLDLRVSGRDLAFMRILMEAQNFSDRLRGCVGRCEEMGWGGEKKAAEKKSTERKSTDKNSTDKNSTDKNSTVRKPTDTNPVYLNSTAPAIAPDHFLVPFDCRQSAWMQVDDEIMQSCDNASVSNVPWTAFMENPGRVYLNELFALYLAPSRRGPPEPLPPAIPIAPASAWEMADGFLG